MDRKTVKIVEKDRLKEKKLAKKHIILYSF